MTRPVMSVTIRGKTYESVAEAAKVLRVSKSTVYCALSRRNIDTVGTGRGNRSKKRGGKPPKPVEIGNHTFPSMAALAREIGVPVKSVRQTLGGRRGWRSRMNLMRKVMEHYAKKDSETRKAREKNDS